MRYPVIIAGSQSQSRWQRNVGGYLVRIVQLALEKYKKGNAMNHRPPKERSSAELYFHGGSELNAAKLTLLLERRQRRHVLVLVRERHHDACGFCYAARAGLGPASGRIFAICQLRLISGKFGTSHRDRHITSYHAASATERRKWRRCK